MIVRATPRRSRRALHWWVLAAFLLAFVVNTLAYAGLARSPASRALFDGAGREAPLMLVHLHTGRIAATIPGVADAGVALAGAAYGRILPVIEREPRGAVDLLERGDPEDSAHDLVRAMHWAAPILLLAWLLAFQFRTRRVHLVGAR